MHACYLSIHRNNYADYVTFNPSVDGVTKALLKITESKFESKISSPLMDTILQQSPTTASHDDHMISDDIIEGVIEVSMIIKMMSLYVTINSIYSQWTLKSSPGVMITWYAIYILYLIWLLSS